MKVKRKIIEIDEVRCSGCGRCVTACAEGAIAVIDGKARLVSENFCDGLGACLGECPEGAMRISERESEQFDPEAVEEHLKHKKTGGAAHEETDMARGCPSRNIQVFFSSRGQRVGALGGTDPGQIPSSLGHWPVQIRLIPPTAPFLQHAALLIAADCTPLAYAGFHRELLPGRVVMLGCPKFDDVEECLKKFTDILKIAGIKSVTVVDMEVPCCSKLPLLVRKAVSQAGVSVPMEEIVISRRGEVLTRRKVA